MSAFEFVLAALGGNAALLIVLGWLARKLGSQILAKDLERFKADLEATSSSELERTRHELGKIALEHQVVFSKLHERRAEVVAELYGLLVEAHWASQAFASVGGFQGDPSKQEQYATAMRTATDLYRYFDKNRIYLPEAVCRQLEEFVRRVRIEIVGFAIYATQNDDDLSPTMIQKEYDAWIKVAEYFNTEAPAAKALLDREFRTLLGVPIE